MIIDPHIHLLPGFGDGPADENEAEKMLISLEKSGVSCAVAVTHLELSRMQDRVVFPRRLKEAQRTLKRLQLRIKSRVKLRSWISTSS